MIQDSKMQLAKRLSFKSKHRVRIGAVISNKRHIVGVGFNKMDKTHPLITSRNPKKKIHAEVDAIIGVDRRHLDGATIFVYRELRNGKIGFCKPCVDCQAILAEVGVRRAIYTDPTQKDSIGEIDL